MALTEEFEYDCEVRGAHKNVQVRKATIIKKDGAEVSRNFHRHVLVCRKKTGDTWGDTDMKTHQCKLYVTQSGLAMLNLHTKLGQTHKHVHSKKKD